MKKNDIILTLVILVIACIGIVSYYMFYKKPGSYIEITVDGKVYKTLPLNEDTTFTIKTKDNHENILEIKNGYANMTDADCPDELCVHQEKIHSQGETIVCLPHKVVITVISEEKSTIDGIAS